MHKMFRNLPFTGRDNTSHNTTGIRTSNPRVHKQDIVAHRMFGNKRKNIQTGHIFRGSKNRSRPKAPKMEGDMRSSSISPSIAEFDKMMASISKKASNKNKMFNKKY